MAIKKRNIVQEYRAKEAINYSSLSALATNPQAYITRDDMEVISAFRKGSAVDCLLTTPDDFYSDFYVMSVNKVPSGMMMKYVEKLFELGDGIQKGFDPYEAAYIASGYKLKPELIREKFEVEGKEYYEGLKDARGKTILSYDEYTQVQMAAKQVKEGEFTAKYFTPQTNKDYKIYYQFPIYWEMEGHTCKSLLDLLVVDHATESIYPIDLKTTGKSALNFKSAFMKWKYYLQAAFYTEAVIFWKNNDTDLVNYEVKNFKFIVVETVGTSPPVIYETTDKDLDVGRNSGLDQYGNYIKGFVELISDLSYHEKEGVWDFPKEIYENNGIAILDTMAK